MEADRGLEVVRIGEWLLRYVGIAGGGNLKKVTPGPLVARCHTTIPARPESYMFLKQICVVTMHTLFRQCIAFTHSDNAFSLTMLLCVCRGRGR